MAGGCDVQHARQERIRAGTTGSCSPAARAAGSGWPFWMGSTDSHVRWRVSDSAMRGVFAVVVESASRAATVGRHWNECRPLFSAAGNRPSWRSGVPFELRAEPISIADMDRVCLLETAQSSAGVRRVVAVAAQRFNDCPLLGEGSLAYGDMPLSLGHPGECQSSVHDTTIPDIRRRPGTINSFCVRRGEATISYSLRRELAARVPPCDALLCLTIWTGPKGRLSPVRNRLPSRSSLLPGWRGLVATRRAPRLYFAISREGWQGTLPIESGFMRNSRI